jgi:hypothetical protein
MDPTHSFTCPHALGQEAVDAELYKIPVCTTANSGTGRFYYKIIKECYIPGHDCTFNVLDTYSSTEKKTLNVWFGKRERGGNSYGLSKSLEQEAEDFGTKKIKVDSALANRLCTLAQAHKFVKEQTKEVNDLVEHSEVLKEESNV